MNPFVYENPTKLRFGINSVASLSQEIIRYGKAVLLLYGSGSAKTNGSYDQVKEQLEQAGCRIIEHGGVSGNPLLSHTQQGVDLVRQHSLECVVAVGGGSVIDEAKAIAAGALYSGDLWDFYAKTATVTKALPIISILTLPATASEMNGFSVLTHDKTHEKNAIGAAPILNPKVSFCDPSFTMTLSKEQTAFAAADIISHLTEGYFTTSAEILNPQDALIEGAVRSVIETMALLQKNPQNLEARSSLMWTATLAWNGILQAGIPHAQLPCHALEMPLSGIYNIAHGAGLAIITPHWMRAMSDVHGSRIKRFGENVFGVSDSVELVINALKETYKKFGAPLSMKEVGVDEIDRERLIQDGVNSFTNRRISGYDERIIRKIYESI